MASRNEMNDTASYQPPRTQGTLPRILLNCVMRAAALLLVAGIAMILVRHSSGFDADERDLDPSLGAATRNAIRDQHQDDGRLLPYAAKLVQGALHGDFGESRSLGTRVRERLVHRGPATLRILSTGTAAAWLA